MWLFDCGALPFSQHTTGSWCAFLDFIYEPGNKASYQLASVSVPMGQGLRLVPKSEILLQKILSSGLGFSVF